MNVETMVKVLRDLGFRVHENTLHDTDWLRDVDGCIDDGAVHVRLPVPSDQSTARVAARFPSAGKMWRHREFPPTRVSNALEMLAAIGQMEAMLKAAK